MVSTLALAAIFSMGALAEIHPLDAELNKSVTQASPADSHAMIPPVDFSKGAEDPLQKVIQAQDPARPLAQKIIHSQALAEMFQQAQRFANAASKEEPYKSLTPGQRLRLGLAIAFDAPKRLQAASVKLEIAQRSEADVAYDIFAITDLNQANAQNTQLDAEIKAVQPPHRLDATLGGQEPLKGLRAGPELAALVERACRTAYQAQEKERNPKQLLGAEIGEPELPLAAARTALAKILLSDPEPEAVAQKKPEKSEEAAFIEKYGIPIFEELQLFADLKGEVEELLDDKKWPEAMAECEQTIKEKPKFYGGYYCRAMARQAQLQNEHGVMLEHDAKLRNELRPQFKSIAADYAKAGELAAQGGLQYADDVSMCYADAAELLVLAGDFDIAIAALDNAKYAQLLGSSKYVVRQNQIRMLKKDYRGMVEKLSSEIRADQYLESPPNADYLLLRGQAYAKLGQPEEALRDFDQAVQSAEPMQGVQSSIDEKLAEIYEARSEIKRSSGDDEGASQDDLWHRAALAVKGGDWPKARELYTQAIETIKTPQDRARAYAGRARSLFATSKMDQARADWTQAIALAPSPWYYAGRAELLRKEGNRQGALEDYSRAMQNLSPNLRVLRSEWLLARGELYCEAKQFDLALKDLDPDKITSLRGDWKKARFYGTRGLAYFGLGEKKKADDEFHRAQNSSTAYFRNYVQPMIAKMQPPSDPQRVKQAWDLGHALGMLTIAQLRPGEAGTIPKQFAALEKQAQEMKVALPPWPKSTDAHDDLLAMVKYLNEARTVVAPKLTELYGRECGLGFDLSASTHALLLVYRTNAPKMKEKMIAGIEQAGSESGLPPMLWKPVVEKAKANAPYNDFLAATKKMFQEVPQHLAQQGTMPDTSAIQTKKPDEKTTR